MSQIALRLVHSQPTPHPTADADTDPRDLSDAELLARFVPGAVLSSAGGLRAALDTPGDELVRRHGVDRLHCATLRAAVELGRRYVASATNPGEHLITPDTTRAALMARLRDLHHEVFACLFLTTRHRILAYEEMFRGTIDGVSVHPREVAKRALELNAATVVVAHNHPSGDPTPSRADRAFTKRLHDALALIDVRLLDHFVIGDGKSVSFAELGLL